MHGRSVRVKRSGAPIERSGASNNSGSERGSRGTRIRLATFAAAPELTGFVRIPCIQASEARFGHTREGDG